MANLAKLPHQLEAKTAACRAVIETPKGNLGRLDDASEQTPKKPK